MSAKNHLDVKMTVPGSLAAEIGDRAGDIESLSVEGPVNASDFDTMWKCSFEGKLVKIDLEKAMPENNEILDNAFWKEARQKLSHSYSSTYIDEENRNKLAEIKLPEGIEESATTLF